jgi:hypothetical protein
MANRVVGIITRKDLMGFNLERKLELRKRRGFSLEGGIQRLLPSERCFASTSSPSITAAAASAAGSGRQQQVSSSLTSSLTAVDTKNSDGDLIV